MHKITNTEVEASFFISLSCNADFKIMKKIVFHFHPSETQRVDQRSPGTHHDAVGLSSPTAPLPGLSYWYDALVQQLLQDLAGLRALLVQQVWETDKIKNSSGCARWIFLYAVCFISMFSPASLSLTPVRGGSFLGTAPGNTGISLFSITTPLSVVPFDTAESPRPSSLLPVSSWQHRDTI